MKIKSTVATPILLIAVFVLVFATSAIPREMLGFDENPYLSVVILQLIVYAIPALIFCTLRGRGYGRGLRLRLPPVSSVLLIISALIFMLSGSSLIGLLMSRAFPEAMAASSTAEGAAFAMNSGIFDGLYVVLAFAILPAVTEEFLFRGIVLTEYGTLGVGCAVIMSALCFAMSHFSLCRLPGYFFCGAVLALLTYATRSILAAMLVHTVYNIFVLFGEQYILHLAEKQNISGVLFLIITAVIMIASAMFAAFEASSVYGRYAVDNVPSDYVPKKKKRTLPALATSLFSPAFLSLAVIFTIFIIVGA